MRGRVSPTCRDGIVTNLGDCCAYAAAVMHAEPLLHKDDGFAKTDVCRAAW